MTAAASPELDPISSSFDAPRTQRPVTASPVVPPAASSGGASRSIPPLPQLEKYELLDELGHGGMATVYRAHDRRLGRDVAVKIIHRHLRENPEVAARFVAEARAAAKLRHPGIVEVFDVSSEEDPERYLVAELIRGCTLRKVLEQHPELPAEVGAAIVFVLCQALEHAHAASIVHRDIKPENVLVELPVDREEWSRACPEGHSLGRLELGESSPGANPQEVARSRLTLRSPRDPDETVVIKLTDFGIAKLLDVQGVTSTGQVLGSPAHMAPEQIEGGEVDARTDVFALGVLMYECLVGHLPFEGRNPAQVLRRVLEGVYPAPDRERPAVGGRWASIVAGALAHDRAMRTASAAELGEQIKAELKALGIADPRAEIHAYFADPTDYVRTHSSRIVPKLIARGEAERKTQRVPLAAADFNRALALAPSDATILKRISTLRSNAARRRLLGRASLILAGSVGLGLVAFAVARSTRGHIARQPIPPTPAASDHGLEATVTGSLDSEAPQPSAKSKILVIPSASVTSASKRGPRIAAAPTMVPPPPPPIRNVKFEITPKGGALSLDGSPRPWFGKVLPLSVGRHEVLVTIKSRCCKELSASVNVEAPQPSKLDEVQTIFLAMPIEPASISISGAPVNGQLSCPDLQLSLFSGGSRSVKLRDAIWSGTCTFAAPEKPAKLSAVNLKAGETNVVPWPSE